MKKNIFVLCAILINLGLNVNAQVTMGSGGWSTSNANRYTRITGTNNLDNKVYQIECTYMTDNDILQFRLIVDGVTLPVTFHEGSYVTVEGKSIAIQQITPGKMIRGTWKIIQQPEISANSSSWNYVPRVNADMLIASLKTEQEFLLSINYSSTNCTNTSMTVIIDGQPVLDNNNNPLIFWEGSTIYGKGKTVVIRAAGTCTGNNTVNGDFKIKK